MQMQWVLSVAILYTFISGQQCHLESLEVIAATHILSPSIQEQVELDEANLTYVSPAGYIDPNSNNNTDAQQFLLFLR